MKGKLLPLSVPRRFICDIMEAANSIPSVPIQREMNLATLCDARRVSGNPIGWTALFVRGFGLVARQMPELRRSYVKLPWPSLYQYPRSSAAVVVERDLDGDKVIFVGIVADPAQLDVQAIEEKIRGFKEQPLEQCKDFQRQMRLSSCPWALRKLVWYVGANYGRFRPNYMGTFCVTSCSNLGAETLHPIAPTTFTLSHGTVRASGQVAVRLTFDHRVIDGADIARALELLERVMNQHVLEELGPAARSQNAA